MGTTLYAPTEGSQGGIGLLTAKTNARHILHIKSIRNRRLLATTECNPKITIICAYSATEETSVTDKDTYLLIVFVTFHSTSLLN